VRKTAYYRYLIIGPMLAWLLPGWFAPRADRFTAYCLHRVGHLPAYTRFVVQQISATEYEIRGGWLWRTYTHHFVQARVQTESGWLADELRLSDDQCDIRFAYRAPKHAAQPGLGH
jgi:hypothetical protein